MALNYTTKYDDNENIINHIIDYDLDTDSEGERKESNSLLCNNSLCNNSLCNNSLCNNSLCNNYEEENTIKECRICFETYEDEVDKLFSPCKCSGTQKYIHESCLNRWRLENINNEKSKKCEICKTFFIFKNTFTNETFYCTIRNESKMAVVYLGSIIYFIGIYFIGYTISIFDNNYNTLKIIPFSGKNSTIYKELINLNIDINYFHLMYYSGFASFVIQQLYFFTFIILDIIFIKQKKIYFSKMKKTMIKSFLLSFNIQYSQIFGLCMFNSMLMYYILLLGLTYINLHTIIKLQLKHNDVLNKINRNSGHNIIIDYHKHQIETRIELATNEETKNNQETKNDDFEIAIAE